MASNAVPGFLPSRHGFTFANRWPAAPARVFRLGLVQVGIGDASRGLCGGMAFVTRDRFELGGLALVGAGQPEPGSPLFEEIVDRQLDSFGPLWTVPLRFWLAALGGQGGRDRATVRSAWPAIRDDIDGGVLSMVGLVRSATANPLDPNLGHQVIGYRYDEAPSSVTIGVYDPNHPGDDTVTVGFDVGPSGELSLRQSTGEPLLGLLHLPWREARPPSSEA
jgi:hypothetical protein